MFAETPLGYMEKVVKEVEERLGGYRKVLEVSLPSKPPLEPL